MTIRRNAVRAVTALLAMFGGATAPPNMASAAASQAMSAPCESLRGMTIAPARMGLPTRGGQVVAADIVPARVDGPHPHGLHCRISGVIRPMDPKSFDIRFEVRLPAQWNGKGLMMGGGGFSGTIPKLDENSYTALPTAPSALARGYAVFGGDAGHPEDPAEPGRFLLNEEAYRNWMGDAIKKTRDAAISVIRAAYGSAPSGNYFLGGSSGGREGLIAAGRWPRDWNGIISLYPARNQMVEIIGGLGINQAFAAPGAYPSPAKRAALLTAALQACDSLDGARDGIISAVRQCNARFEPGTAMVHGKPLRCPGGADTGDDCLSDPQLKALAVMHNPQTFGFRLANGEDSFPGYNVYTSDGGVPKNNPLQQMVTFLALGVLPPGFPAKPGMPLMATFGDNFVRYGIAEDAGVNPLTVGPGSFGPYISRLREMSRLDIPERDLTAFAKHGGKLLLMHGTADMIVSPRISETLYETLQQNMGKKGVADFMRFYEVPGFGHAISTDFMAGWDYLSALENWREHGIDPGDREVVTDLMGVPGRSRPLCRYPAWPQYDGKGDIDKASSFDCATD